jgi:hypothetical protein
MSNMKVFSALAALVATASIVAAQDGTFRPAAPPAPAGIPEHDPSAETVRQFESGDRSRMVAYDNDPARPQPAFMIQGEGRGKSGTGMVEILPHDNGVGGKSLADTLTLDRRGRVWWDYAREVDSVVSLSCLYIRTRANVTEPASTICRPEHIARTHRFGNHETRQETVSILFGEGRFMLIYSHQNNDGQTSDDEAERNVERFLAAHIIPVSRPAVLWSNR